MPARRGPPIASRREGWSQDNLIYLRGRFKRSENGGALSRNAIAALGNTMTDTTAIDNVIPRADILKRAARIGAEISNIKLSGDLSDQVIGAINKLLLEHKVIFFRDQGHLDDAEQERVGLRLGKLVPHPTIGATKGNASILELDSARGGGRADQWHTDVTFVDAYPKISILRGVVIPPFGGDTIWSYCVCATRFPSASYR